MKTIQTSELKVGDIFCHSMKLHGREAFELLEEVNPEKSTILVKSRLTGKIINQRKRHYVVLPNKI